MPKLVFSPEMVIWKIYAAVWAMHLRLDGILVNLEIPLALRVIAFPPEESLIGRKADRELEVIGESQGNPFTQYILCGL